MSIERVIMGNPASADFIAKDKHLNCFQGDSACS